MVRKTNTMEILTAELHEALDNQRLTPIKNQISAQRTSTQDIPQNTWEELLGCKEQSYPEVLAPTNIVVLPIKI